MQLNGKTIGDTDSLHARLHATEDPHAPAVTTRKFAAHTRPLCHEQRKQARGLSYQQSSELSEFSLKDIKNHSDTTSNVFSLSSERKFDEISEGIDEIKKLLQERSSDLREHQPHHRADSDSPLIQDTIETGRKSPCPFTGGSSFTAHSLEAKRFVDSIAAQTTLDSDLERDDLLACLRELLRHKNDEIVVHQISFSDQPHPTSTCSKAKSLPPLDAAVFILKWAKGTMIAICSHLIFLQELISWQKIIRTTL